MHRFLCTIFFLCVSLCISAQLPPLTILAGQTVNLPARTYQYSSINIQSGGTLVIDENSQTWCVLYCTGNVTIHGSIIFRKFYSTRDAISAVSPNGDVLTYTFKMQNNGGNGGYGGECATSAIPTRGIGGTGANGTVDNGGGGGAGAASRGYPNRYQANGSNANGSNGGRRQLTTDGDGGNGGVRLQYGNGGLLYIFCLGNFDGASGEIHLEGENGPNGTDGIEGESGFGSNSGGGGGGGGAPGGEGGKFSVRTKGNYTAYPTVYVQGGKGGQGGQGKNNVRANDFIPPLRGGDGGQNGQSGASGIVDYLK
jgi:hypothetical protein